MENYIFLDYLLSPLKKNPPCPLLDLTKLTYLAASDHFKLLLKGLLNLLLKSFSS